MAHVPILTRELALILERHAAPGTGPASAVPGRELRHFGHAIALKARTGRPSNEVYCFGALDLEHLPEILHFYEVDGLSPSFYLTPMGFNSEVSRALTKAGFSQTSFEQAILYGVPSAEPPALPRGLTIEPVTPDNLEEFAETTAAGFEWSPAWREAAKRGVRENFSPGTSMSYLARMNGLAAGVASLKMRDNIASLAEGAVIPSQRGQGCHLALLRHRLYMAYSQGATLVLGGANFGSGSFRNQLRVGLRLAYIESTWERV